MPGGWLRFGLSVSGNAKQGQSGRFIDIFVGSSPLLCIWNAKKSEDSCRFPIRTHKYREPIWIIVTLATDSSQIRWHLPTNQFSDSPDDWDTTVHPSTWFSISKSHRNHRYAGRTRNYEWPMRTSGDFKLLRANSLVDLDFSVFGVWFSVFGTFLARGKPFIQINPATSICITLWSRFCFSATLLIKFSYLYVKIYIYEF